MRLSLHPSSRPPSPTEVIEAVRALRSELDSLQDDEERALLLNEIGVLSELHRDDHAAARDLLSAVNAATALREPLERLIALVERRHSYQNLGKLLDRLGRVASSPEDVVRAQLARGDFLSDHRNDDDEALQAYEIAERAGCELTAVWLSLEWLAAKTNNTELRERVLEARAARTNDPAYRSLLKLRAAQTSLAHLDDPTTLQTLSELASSSGPTRDRALSLLEDEAAKAGDDDRLAELHEARALVYTQALEQPSEINDHALAPQATSAVATELWLRAARTRSARGEVDRASANLARAERLMGSNPAVFHALVDIQSAAGNGMVVAQAVTRVL